MKILIVVIILTILCIPQAHSYERKIPLDAEKFLCIYKISNNWEISKYCLIIGDEISVPINVKGLSREYLRLSNASYILVANGSLNNVKDTRDLGFDFTKMSEKSLDRMIFIKEEIGSFNGKNIDFKEFLGNSKKEFGFRLFKSN